MDVHEVDDTAQEQRLRLFIENTLETIIQKNSNRQIDVIGQLEARIKQTIKELMKGINESGTRLSSIDPTVDPEQTQNVLNNSVREAQRLKVGLDETMAQAVGLFKSTKKQIVLRKLGLVCVWLVTAAATTWGITWYYPRNVHYDYFMTRTEAHNILVGEVLRENFNQLTPKQRAFLNLKFNEKFSGKDKPSSFKG